MDAKLSDEHAIYAQALAARFPQVRVLRRSQPLSLEVARTFGAVQASGEFVVFLTADVRIESGWLDPLIAPLAAGEAAATQPLVLLQDGIVWSAGIAFGPKVSPHALFRTFPGDAPEVVKPGTRTALSARCLAVRADDFVRVRGFDPMLVNAVDSGDLSLRLAETTRRPLAYIPGSVVSLLAEPTRASGRWALDNERYFADRWRDVLRPDADEAWRRAGFSIVGYQGMSPRHPDFHPVLVRDRAQRPLRRAIKIGAPTVGIRANWGTGISLWRSRIRWSDLVTRRSWTAVRRGIGRPHDSTT